MTSAYVLAVDIGTSRTAASTARVDTEGIVETARFALGRRTDSTPTAVFVSDDDLLFGEAAERRGLVQPDRLVREFKRRIGDDVPLVVAGRTYAPEHLFARMVTWVADAVAEREGRQPEAIVATVPVTWGDYRRSLLMGALARELTVPVDLVAEPIAAAWHYTASSPLGPDGVLAVYDLGGGTFDIALVGSSPDHWLRIVGTPTGISDFGGADFDDIVLRHTIAAAGLSGADLADDPDARIALSSLRRECVEAKEALSFDSEAAIPVFLAGASTTVRITRTEFEELIERGVERTIDLLQSTLESSDVGGRLEAVLLTGGSSRIPRVAQLLSERCDAPIAVDADPKAVVALGAARIIADGLARGATPSSATAAAETAMAAVGTEAPATGSAPGPDSADDHARRRRWFRPIPATVALTAGSLVLAGGIVLAGATELGNGTRAPSDAGVDSFADWLGTRLSGGSAAAAEPDAAGPQDATNAAPPPAKGTPPQDASSPNPRRRIAERGAEERQQEAAGLEPGAESPTSPSTSTGTSGTADDPAVPTGTDPQPDPAPQPEPSPGPQPEPSPDPQPEPAPDPQPEPSPDPQPDPDPPAPDPTPDPPAPDPPAPEPEPPAPEPEPSPPAASVPEPQ